MQRWIKPEAKALVEIQLSNTARISNSRLVTFLPYEHAMIENKWVRLGPLPVAIDMGNYTSHFLNQGWVSYAMRFSIYEIWAWIGGCLLLRGLCAEKREKQHSQEDIQDLHCVLQLRNGTGSGDGFRCSMGYRRKSINGLRGKGPGLHDFSPHTAVIMTA